MRLGSAWFPPCSRPAIASARSDTRAGERVIVEFVSANPTGPLHVGHGRQAALGDAIASLLEWQGCAVSREFYYNDAGQQIHNLAVSVRARAHEILGESGTFPEDGYRGEYIREIAQRYLDEVGHDLSDIETIRRFAVAELRKEQDRDLQAFGVKLRPLLPRKLAVYRRSRRRDRQEARGIRHHVREAKARCGCARRRSATTRIA